MDKRKRGGFAEEYATKLLSRNGYKIIERNFTTSFSEIDIIAIHKDTLVFIEVKARWSKKYGNPEEAVNKSKLIRIKRAGDLYISKNPNLPKRKRIDVVSLVLEKEKIISERIIKVF